MCLNKGSCVFATSEFPTENPHMQTRSILIQKRWQLAKKTELQKIMNDIFDKPASEEMTVDQIFMQNADSKSYKNTTKRNK